MSTSAVHQRVRRLEERGVIKGYTAVVDHTALNLPLTAFISISPLDPAAPDDIPERLSDLPELEACHSVAGDENYILKARVRTPGDLEDLLARIATANVATRTTVVLSTPWEAGPAASAVSRLRSAGDVSRARRGRGDEVAGSEGDVQADDRRRRPARG